MKLPQVPAAQYVRMSTEDQQYSIINQQAKIQDYATKHGFSISRTYSDAGRSGIVIKGREGLAALLKDVVSGNASYKAILVYDVSRWGRFQNPDEAAHYEFLCSAAGIPIHYCAEQFVNDGSLPSSIMKALKRTMAGEYSRELSVKVFDGQKRLVQLGFRVGGSDVYGLRRMVVSSDGRKKHLLKPAEAKSIMTDRVILVPGKKFEVERVRQMFHMAAIEKKSLVEIAAFLNKSHVKSLSGLPWSRATVYYILKNPEYAGCAVWGRTSSRLHGKRKRQPRSQWIITPGVFLPVVDDALFQKAQKVLERRNNLPRKSDKEILDRLRRVLVREGKLSGPIIQRTRGLLRPSVYCHRFGSFLKLYQLVGYTPPARMAQRSMTRLRASNLRKMVFDELVNLFPKNVVTVRIASWDRRHVIKIDGRFLVSIYLCHRFLTQGGNPRWLFDISDYERNNITLICCINATNERILAYYVVPAPGQLVRNTKNLRIGGSFLAGGIKLEQLSEFYRSCKTLEGRIS